jgi:hypothetical protein
MKRLVITAALLVVVALALAGGWFFRPHPELEPAATVVPPEEVTTKDLKGTVQTLPLKAGDPVTIRMELPDSRWKAAGIAAQNVQTREVELDMGLGYEVIRIQPETQPITVPLLGWEIGSMSLPEMSADVLATPDRFGVGGSLALNEYLDLMAGVSRRWDDEALERYVGIGVKVMW